MRSINGDFPVGSASCLWHSNEVTKGNNSGKQARQMVITSPDVAADRGNAEAEVSVNGEDNRTPRYGGCAYAPR